MKHILHLTLLLLAIVSSGLAQGPVIRQPDQWTYAYEDISDFLRRYPGLYPMDMGALSYPVIFRPWYLDPWSLRVDRDGLPQERRYDGLFPVNLQPAAELDTIRFDFLRGNSAGLVDLGTRTLPVDSPYTEFQIREGFYGYGTVDFAHGQRIYNSLTAEITGRLVWYDDFRKQEIIGANFAFGGARLYRLRGRVGYNLGKRWRADLNYGGADNDTKLNYWTRTDQPLIRFHRDFYEEREEGVLTFAQTDTFRTALDPRLKLFLRQDREEWSTPFRAREQQSGALLELHANLPRQRLSLRQLATYTEMKFPGVDKARETALELRLEDSIGVAALTVRPSVGLRWESLRPRPGEVQEELLRNVGVRADISPLEHVTVFGGLHYSEQNVPVLWRYGNYPLADRFLLLAPQLTDTFNTFVGQRSDVPFAGDAYLKSMAGIRYRRDEMQLGVSVMGITPQGDETYGFVEGFLDFADMILLIRGPRASRDSQVGLCTEAVIPLRWGLRLDSWTFTQMNSSNIGGVVDQRAFSRLYWEQKFFSSPLTMRAHFSHEYIGSRTAFSDAGEFEMPSSNVVGFRISGTIGGVTLMWGTENLLAEHYQILPGYPMIGKEEYLLFIWRLWL